MKKTNVINQHPLGYLPCLFFLLLGIAIPAEAQVKEITREVTGRAKTAEQAVVNGLIEAVNQIGGLEVDSSKTIQSSFQEIYTAKKGKKPTTETLGDDLYKEKVVLKSMGLVKSYKVNDIRKDADGLWEAKLTVTIPIYVSPGYDKSHLRRIAVTLFRTAVPQFAFGRGQLPAADVSRRLNQKLVTQLTHARKFRVLDQQFDLEINKQFDRLKGGKAPVKELARLGRRLGTDYLLVGTINQFNLKQRVEKPGFGLPDEVLSTANAIVEFRVIEAATQQVMWSNEANLLFDNNELVKLVPQFNIDQLIQAISGLAADEIVNEILDIIYPIKVMDTGGQIVLNQGGKRVRLGTYYKIEGPAKTVVDPDTGLPIKIGGAKTTTVVITEVKPKYSIAKIVEGNQDIKNGQVCRRTQVQVVAPPVKKEK
jgi:hypothetical protein